MEVNVLPGDSLVEQFNKTQIDGEVIVCRECFVDGDLKAAGLEEFWNVRDSYLSGAFDKPDDFYEEKVKNEFIKLWNLADGNTINLWFEYELFCQVNLWFCIWLLRNTEADFHLVYPQLDSQKDIWKGFSFLDVKKLKKSFDNRIKLNHDDIFLAIQLWEAFQNRDFEKLTELGKTESKSFPSLKEVVEAAIAIDTRPKESLKKIIDDGNTDFGQVFGIFNEVEAVYGFGDLQVKKIFDKIVD